MLVDVIWDPKKSKTKNQQQENCNSIINKKCFFKKPNNKKNAKKSPWLVQLSWLGIIPQSERSPVRFPVRAHTYDAGSIPRQGTYKKQPTSVSLLHRYFSPSLSPSLPLTQNN